MDSTENKLGKLAEESLKRMERLKRLREEAVKSSNQAEDSSAAKQQPRPVFRSYKPQNEETATNGEVLQQEPTGDIEKAVQDQMELLRQPMIVDEIDIANLAPRKPDWDLKRDVAKKLERLDRRTQKAIAELIRERLKKNQEEQDLFQAVNVGTAHAGEAVDSVDY